MRGDVCRAEGPGGGPWVGRRGPRQGRQRCPAALGCLVLSAALERRFRPRLLSDFRGPRCAPCGTMYAEPRGRAASLGSAGEARGTPGSPAQRHLGAWCYLQHWNGDSGRGYYVTSVLRGARHAGQYVPSRGAGAASLGSAGEARGTPGSPAQRHLRAWCYLQHWNGDSGRGCYVTSTIRGARRAAQSVPRRWAGRRALGRPAGPAARTVALHSGTWALGAQDVCTTRAAMLDLVHGWVLYGSSFRWS